MNHAAREMHTILIRKSSPACNPSTGVLRAAWAGIFATIRPAFALARAVAVSRLSLVVEQYLARGERQIDAAGEQRFFDRQQDPIARIECIVVARRHHPPPHAQGHAVIGQIDDDHVRCRVVEDALHLLQGINDQGFGGRDVVAIADPDLVFNAAHLKGRIH